MSFIDQLKLVQTRKGYITFSVITYTIATLTWTLHFYLEFSVLEALDLEPINILFHLAAVPAGVLFFLLWSSKRDPVLYYIFSGTLLGLSMIGLVLTRDTFAVFLLLAVAGFSIGNMLSLVFILASPLLPGPEYNGRIVYLAFMPVMITLMLGAVIDYNFTSRGDVLFYTLFLGGLSVIFLLASLSRRDELTLPPRKTPLRYYFRKNVIPYPVLLLGFFIGFFFINVYYAAVLLLRDPLTAPGSFPYPASLNIFALVLFITCLIVSLPSGFLLDTIGRRWSILAGFYIEALAFFLVAVFLNILDKTVLLLVIFPVMAGAGFSLALFGGMLATAYEMAPKEHPVAHPGALYIFFGIGMVLGVLMDEALLALVQDQPFLLPVVLIVVYFTATIVVFQLDEPLPSKAELEWRRKTEHVIVLSRSGLPLYSEPLQKRELAADAILAGGAIIGISTLSSEITRATHLKVIKHENYCIMLEEGAHVILAVMVTEELKTVRDKMMDFVADFESFFEDFLVDWTGDTRVFAPARKLIEKHFA
ncbi:MAG: MFS transporter [Candidatus Odinarchaeota archaeon]